MTTSNEYKVFHDNFDRLCVAVSGALSEVARKAFAKRLISDGNLAKANMAAHTEYERASELVMVLLKRIEMNKDDFYTILNIFKSILVLEGVAGQLEKDISASRSGTAASTRPDTTAAAMTSSAGSSSKLQERPNTKQAFSALLPVADKWKQIGALLDVPPGTLGSIQNESSTDRDRLLSLVNHWLTTLNVSWSSLIEAVEMVNEHLAKQIREKYS